MKNYVFLKKELDYCEYIPNKKKKDKIFNNSPDSAWKGKRTVMWLKKFIWEGK